MSKDVEKRLVVGMDGDDTLWHNENILWSAEQKFQQVLLHYLSAEDLSHRLYETEMRNLSLFGYGAKGFVLSMIETAIEVTDGRIAVADIQSLVDLLKEIIWHPVHLIDSAAHVVEELSRSYRLILISKGELFHQEHKVASSGLADFFSAVEIVSEKDQSVYARILTKYDVDPSNFVMVGNSLRSDIDPILKLGARAIHVPYEITWKHEGQSSLDPKNRTYVLCNSLTEVAHALREMESMD
ncbi:haloacid dehalogenase (plasmid) [Aminobacter sp. Y103A]|uniref:HAD family hydrolase n=1 Tax=Phyllobacteriaceae TaxID=69277 RepID=UPI0018EDD65E|nr:MULTISPECIES: HAD family hydrolase [Phyllobacteriaceae]BBD41323.1 haloacid dehalogenase [Aminobacter sp. SS-2016]BCH20123.1 haloacid dehalogenase [Mesorhizobium sp. L-2-11]